MTRPRHAATRARDRTAQLLHEPRASAEAWAGAAEALFALAGGDAPFELISVRPGASISEIRLGVPLRVAP